MPYWLSINGSVSVSAKEMKLAVLVHAPATAATDQAQQAKQRFHNSDLARSVPAVASG